MRHERHDLFFRGVAHSAWARRRRHNPGRTIGAARRISGESENVRRRALGRAQHDAIHGRHLSRRLVFGISRLALFVLLQHSGRVAGRRRRGFAAVWPRVAAALPAFRLRWVFLAGGDSFRVADDFQHGQRLRLVPLADPGRRADRGGAGAALLHHLGAWRTASGARHAAVRPSQLRDRHDLLGGGVLLHSGILVDFRHSDAAASRLQFVPRRRRLSFDAAFVRAVRRRRARTVQARRHPA